MEITLKTGEKRQGQLLATYDHSVWWVDPSPEKTLALFDPSKFAEYPDDASSSFFSSYDVTSVKDITLPPGTVVYRDMLRDKGWVIGQMPVEGPLHVGTGNGGLHLEEMGQSDFAWDLVRAKPDGKHFNGTGKLNTDYLIWNAEIKLPVDGYVIEVKRDAPDNTPGQTSIDQPSNVVTVHIGGQFYMYFLHMRQNTIPASVQVGAALPAGTTIGRVGNSGASIEPHLHVGLLWYDGVTQRAWSLPVEWKDVWSSPKASGDSTHHDYHVPEVGTWISGVKF